MNQPTLLAAAVGLLLLPIASRAGDPELTPSPDQYPVVDQATQTANDGIPEKTAMPKNNEGELGGVLVHNGKAYIVSRLQNEMSLPDGRKVEPDGKVVAPDGSSKQMNSGEMLQLDGQIAPAPFEANSKPESRTDTPQGSFNGTSDVLSGGDGFPTAKPSEKPEPPANDQSIQKKEPAETDPTTETPD